MEFQWYPGHMTKAKRQMQEDIKLIDLVIEVIDARCPISSRNPDINGLANGKLRLILLNKSDLADKSVNQKWKDYFKAQGFYCVELDSRDRKNMKGVQATLDEVCAAKFERDRKRGIKNRCIYLYIPDDKYKERIGIRGREGEEKYKQLEYYIDFYKKLFK